MLRRANQNHQKGVKLDSTNKFTKGKHWVEPIKITVKSKHCLQFYQQLKYFNSFILILDVCL